MCSVWRSNYIRDMRFGVKVQYKHIVLSAHHKVHQNFNSYHIHVKAPDTSGRVPILHAKKDDLPISNVSSQCTFRYPMFWKLFDPIIDPSWGYDRKNAWYKRKLYTSSAAVTQFNRNTSRPMHLLYVMMAEFVDVLFYLFWYFNSEMEDCRLEIWLKDTKMH